MGKNNPLKVQIGENNPSKVQLGEKDPGWQDDIYSIELQEDITEKCTETTHEQQEKPTDKNSSEASKTNIIHCHIQREHRMDKKARRKLIVASCFCLSFIILEDKNDGNIFRKCDRCQK